jgi:hypothetical protein
MTVPHVTVSLPPEAIEQIAKRVAEILADRQPGEEDSWLRGADRIAAYVDAPPSRVYALASANRIPLHRDGSALVARRSELDAWMRNGGGKRP